jgi:5-oxopent-3-ene-1,2,5-tricarboxylate decarboxylase/2-hydroxyhepta-2,4-diene-1,7-dioate isomerase
MARDSSGALGSAAAARDDFRDPDVLTMRTFVDGALAATASTAELIRPVARLIADISDFMTLHPGDLLLAGGAADLPRVRAGARVAIEIDRVGRLETHVALVERSAA